MAERRDKRYRVTGEDDQGDIHAFETDSRERAKVMEAQMREEFKHVVLEMVRRI
jgi:hypothetical protein